MGPTKPAAALLFCAGLLLISAIGASSISIPCSAAAAAATTSLDAAWPCIQQARFDRLGQLLEAIHDPSNLGAGQFHAYLTANKAEEVQLLYAAHTTQPELQFADDDEAQLSAQTALLDAQFNRQLLQLSGSLSDLTLTPDNKLTSTSVRKTSIKDPSGTFQAVANGFSSSTTPLDQELAQRLSAFAPSLAAASSTLLGDGPSSSTAAAVSDTPASGGSDQNAGSGSTSGPVVTMDGQIAQEPLQPTLRIVGGVQAPTDRKYVCSLRIATSSNPDFLYCGCSLIAPSVVMTAAHCLADTNLRTPEVEIGRYYQQRPNDTTVNDYDRIQCKAGVVNRAWSDTTAQGDIALCFLESPSRFAPVALADEANTKLTVGQQLTVMGWGATSEGGSQAQSLMTVGVATTDLATCNAAYQNKINGDSQICAGVPQGGKDACQGDSGGPLVVRGNTAADDVQVGLVSYGIGCARPNMPGVYTDVRAYRSWIAQQMLARSVAYSPVTDNFTATAGSVEQVTACACTKDGKSGDISLGASLAGCKQHGLNMGDTDFYCYTQGGSDCSAATASNTHPGAAWLDCTPQVAKTEASTPTQPSSTKPYGQNIVGSSAADLLGSWVGQWLAGAIGRAGPNMTAAVAPSGDSTINRTAAVASRSAGLTARRAAQPVVLG